MHLASSSGEYAKNRRSQLDIVKELRAVGAEIDLDLPKTVVIGNQSAGKSSVVEAISGISVPREAGTCTRCAIECRLRNVLDAPWSCQVSIRGHTGASLQEISEVHFGERITDKTKVEEVIRRAQLAVLNPMQNHQHFLTTPLPDFRPDLTDLSFVDLPGIIHNGDTSHVQMVKQLVQTHIRSPNCLILVVMPMTDQVENQQALALAKEVDPQGIRTIGVLTKPDMLTSGDIDSQTMYLKIIEGHDRRLVHGYYCTRQPNDAERRNKLSSQDARAAEAQFFQNTAPWSTSACKKRFGTENLVNSLGGLLSELIKRRLPHIRSDALKLLNDCKRSISELPEKINVSPEKYMIDVIPRFCEEIRRHVEAGSDYDFDGIIESNRESFKALKKDLEASCPQLIAQPAPPSLIFPSQTPSAVECIRRGQPLYLDTLHHFLQKSIRRELPNNIPFRAKASLISAFQEPWQHNVVNCLQSVQKQLLNLLLGLVETKFGRFAVLQSNLKDYMTSLVDHHAQNCLVFAQALMRMELRPHTLNDDDFKRATNRWLVHFRDMPAGKISPPAQSAERRSHKDQNKRHCPRSHPTPDSDSTAKFANRFPFSGGPNQTDGTSFMSTPAPSTSNSSFFKFGDPPTSASGSSDQGKSFHNSLHTTTFPPTVNTSAPKVNTSAPTVNTSAPTTGTTAPPSNRPTVPPASDIAAALALLAKAGYNVNGTDINSDKYDVELSITAEVRGYWDIAVKRFVDVITATIDQEFVMAVAENLQPYLIEKLGLGDPEAAVRCATLLVEDVNTFAPREELIARKKG
ncbi:hypothetical protein HGRIS_007116 [Hohenbuehelia grisea]|uniref:Uncharacterized protein n=1 Tax=Hohenbuehelia grisea TaxID=104357 RepID=A0ABR3JBU1_9AGAR